MRARVKSLRGYREKLCQIDFRLRVRTFEVAVRSLIRSRKREEERVGRESKKCVKEVKR